MDFQASLLLNPTSSWHPANSGWKSCIISCRCAPEHDLLARPLADHLFSAEILSGAGITPYMGGWSPSKPSICAIQVLLLHSACLLLCSLTGAPFLRSWWNEVLAVAAVAVIFVPRKHSNRGGCEVKVCLGQLKLGGERETLCLQVSLAWRLIGIKCIPKSNKESYVHLFPLPFLLWSQI